jgi:hypothetical protein
MVSAAVLVVGTSFGLELFAEIGNVEPGRATFLAFSFHAEKSNLGCGKAILRKQS